MQEKFVNLNKEDQNNYEGLNDFDCSFIDTIIEIINSNEDSKYMYMEYKYKEKDFEISKDIAPTITAIKTVLGKELGCFMIIKEEDKYLNNKSVKFDFGFGLEYRYNLEEFYQNKNCVFLQKQYKDSLSPLVFTSDVFKEKFPYVKSFLDELTSWCILNNCFEIPDEIVEKIKKNYLKKDVLKSKKLLKLFVK